MKKLLFFAAAMVFSAASFAQTAKSTEVKHGSTVSKVAKATDGEKGKTVSVAAMQNKHHGKKSLKKLSPEQRKAAKQELKTQKMTRKAEHAKSAATTAKEAPAKTEHSKKTK